MACNSDLNTFKKIWLAGKTFNELLNGLFGTNVYKTLESFMIINVNNITMN